MKKVFLLSLGLFLGFGAYAQQSAVKAYSNVTKVSLDRRAVGNEVTESSALNYGAETRESVVVNRFQDFVEGEVMFTTYDLQSNGFVSNRMYQQADGSVGVVATFSHESSKAATDRGTGYSFYDGEDFSEMPDRRAEANATGADIKTGWPSIAVYGETGEIFVCHTGSDGLVYYTRETAGEGTWNGPNAIPNPTDLEGQDGYEFMLSWPRVVTSGENNEIIHVFSAAQLSTADGTVVGQFYSRFADGEWTTNWSPLVDSEEHINRFGGDDYAAAANGNNVAVVYCGYADNHVVLYKSTDNGLTWERSLVWENPYYDAEWVEPLETGMIYMPSHVSLAIGYDGVVHVAMSTQVIQAATLEGEWDIWAYSGLSVDGIVYWNDSYGVPFNEGYPTNAMQLWWEYDPEEYPEMAGYIYNCYDTINFCGFMPVEFIADFTGDSYYKERDYSSIMDGLSTFPSIAVDPEGNLAVAYSSVDCSRIEKGTNKYLRSCFISYKKAGEDGWYVNADNAGLYDDFLHSLDEVLFVNAVANPVNANEFWFSYSSDLTLGTYQGTYATQTSATENTIYAFCVTPSEDLSIEDAQATDVVYNVYPNPASEYIFVSSSMNADATVTFTNIAGQTVKVVNTNLTTGENGISINDLNSGVYFCTVTANGYSHTSKVVVK